MISGTSLVLLAMHATVNVVSPAGAQQASHRPALLGALFIAATFSAIGVLTANRPRPRRLPPAKAQPRRTFGGPRERRR